MLTAQPAFPWLLGFLLRARSWALGKTGEPKASGSFVVPGYRAICMAGLSWSCIPWESRLPGSPPGEVAGNQLGALPVLCWKFIESDTSPCSTSVLMNWHFPMKTCFVAKFLASCSPGCHAVLHLQVLRYGCDLDGVESLSKICLLKRRESRDSQGWYCLFIPLVHKHFFLFFLCWSFVWSHFAEVLCTTLPLNL